VVDVAWVEETYADALFEESPDPFLVPAVGVRTALAMMSKM